MLGLEGKGILEHGLQTIYAYRIIYTCPFTYSTCLRRIMNPGPKCLQRWASGTSILWRMIFPRKRFRSLWVPGQLRLHVRDPVLKINNKGIQRERQTQTDHECHTLHFLLELISLPKLSPLSSSLRMPLGSRRIWGGVLTFRVQAFSELCIVSPHWSLLVWASRASAF